MGTCLCRPFVQHPECETHPSRMAGLRGVNIVAFESPSWVPEPGGLPPAIVDRDPGAHVEDEAEFVRDATLAFAQAVGGGA